MSFCTLQTARAIAEVTQPELESALVNGEDVIAKVRELAPFLHHIDVATLVDVAVELVKSDAIETIRDSKLKPEQVHIIINSSTSLWYRLC